jgi:hypothetical protein
MNNQAFQTTLSKYEVNAIFLKQMCETSGKAPLEISQLVETDNFLLCAT